MAKAMVRRRSCGRRAHGRRIYDWARVEVRPWHRADRRHWVLARRSVSRPEEISYYIAYCPAGTTLDQLIRIAGSRWAVEGCFQTAKQECCPDDYVRPASVTTSGADTIPETGQHSAQAPLQH